MYKRQTQYPSDQASYVVNFNVSPTAQMDMFAIECGANRCVRLQRIVIDNPGALTAGALVGLTLVFTTAAGTGSVVTPVAVDQYDSPFTGICRSGNTGGNLGTAGSTLATYTLWTPTTPAGAFTPLVLEMGGQGQVYKQPTVKLGVANGIALRHPGAAGAAGFVGYAVFVEEPQVP